MNIDHGTGAHTDLEKDVADFLVTEASIIHSQGFSTVPSAIPRSVKGATSSSLTRMSTLPRQKGTQGGGMIMTT
jgi:7-keto-8-aminopelargonate synthetase-like enzyme